MATIHLMVGFLGFGKTTLAKKLAQKCSAIRFTHDEIMFERYGRQPDDFKTKYEIVDRFIREKTKEYIASGQDVILDYGFWGHETREEYYKWAKTLTQNVVFHVLECDLLEAKRRVLERTKNDSDALLIDDNMFDMFLKQYEPWDKQDNYPVVLHQVPTIKYIGKTVPINIDRPLGSKHPKFGFKYPVNYGFVPYTQSGDGEELDAYVLIEDKSLTTYIGQCIAVVHRTDDNDDKLIIVPEKCNLTDEKIEKDIAFQEKWFKHVLLK